MPWRQSQRRRWWRWIRRAFIGAFCLVLAVMALALAYRFVPPPVSALMLIRRVGGESINYQWVPISRISPNLVRAVITSEDARFCLHHGVDWGVLTGLMTRLIDQKREPSRGGSTIDMQTAKNLFLWPERSYVRKALEIPLAYWIDFIWPKERVVEIYLNIAEWGPGIFGAEAAAEYHFHKPATRLSRYQAALMAAVLPNPIERVAGKPSREVKRLARRIERRVAGTLPYLDCLPGIN